MPENAKFATVAEAEKFMLGGNATVTLVSVKTGNRYTYKLKAGINPDDEIFFVSLLGGPDNEADFRYLGRIAKDHFWPGRKTPRPGDIGPDAPSSKAFAWAWNALQRMYGDEPIPGQLEIWHEGRCGRCNRKLTVPASIKSGFGPECLKLECV
jgi:hypothetical protein